MLHSALVHGGCCWISTLTFVFADYKSPALTLYCMPSQQQHLPLFHVKGMRLCLPAFTGSKASLQRSGDDWKQARRSTCTAGAAEAALAPWVPACWETCMGLTLRRLCCGSREPSPRAAMQVQPPATFARSCKSYIYSSHTRLVRCLVSSVSGVDAPPVAMPAFVAGMRV